MKDAEPLRLEPIPGEREHTEVHSFRFKATPGRYLYVRASKGLRSFGGYVLGEHYERIFRVPAYPMELKFMSAGSLLSLSGEKKLPVLARDIDGIRFTIGRVLPQQIQHLVTQSQGNFSNPAFLDNFDETYITERFDLVVQLPRKDPGTPQYHALDLSKYLEADPANRRGIFMLTALSYDPVRQRPTGRRDRRLVVLTDLGIVVKRAARRLAGRLRAVDRHRRAGGGRHGRAPRAATASPLLTQATDAAGHAWLREHERACATSARRRSTWCARAGTSRSCRSAATTASSTSRASTWAASRIRASRAAVTPTCSPTAASTGPATRSTSASSCKAQDWAKALAGRAARGRGHRPARPRGRSARSCAWAPRASRRSRYATQETSPTGNYTRQPLPREGRPARARSSARTTVKVQEFLPDRMKMTAHLSAEARRGLGLARGPEGARHCCRTCSARRRENRRVAATLTLAPAYPAFRS